MRSPWNRGTTGEGNIESPDPLGAAPPGGASGLNAEEWDALRTAPDFDAEEMSNVWPGEAWTPPDLLTDTVEKEPLPAAGPAVPVAGGHPPPAWPPSVGTAPAAPRGGESVAVPPGPSGGPAPSPGAGPAAGEGWRPPNRVEPPARRPAPPWAAGKAGEAVPGDAAGRATVERQPASTAPAAEAVSQRYPEARTLALLAEDLLGRPLDEPLPGPEPAAWPEPPVPAPEADLPQTGPAQPATAGAAGDLWEQVMPLWAESAGQSGA